MTTSGRLQRARLVLPRALRVSPWHDGLFDARPCRARRRCSIRHDPFLPTTLVSCSLYIRHCATDHLARQERLRTRALPGNSTLEERAGGQHHGFVPISDRPLYFLSCWTVASSRLWLAVDTGRSENENRRAPMLRIDHLK